MKEFELPKEFATKWVAELRSGKYKQVKSSLFDCGGYCCLGVAGHLAGLEDVLEALKNNKRIEIVYE